MKIIEEDHNEMKTRRHNEIALHNVKCLRRPTTTTTTTTTTSAAMRKVRAFDAECSRDAASVCPLSWYPSASRRLWAQSSESNASRGLKNGALDTGCRGVRRYSAGPNDR